MSHDTWGSDKIPFSPIIKENMYNLAYEDFTLICV